MPLNDAYIDALDILATSLARSLSTEDLPLQVDSFLPVSLSEGQQVVPRLDPGGQESFVFRIFPASSSTHEGRPEDSGYLVVGIEEPTDIGLFWGFVGPSSNSGLGNIQRLGEDKPLRAGAWEAIDDIIAGDIIRWYGVPPSGATDFVEIPSLGRSASTLKDWSSAFYPPALLIDFPLGQQLERQIGRELSSTIAADLSRLMPLLRIASGLEPDAKRSALFEYPDFAVDERRRIPRIFLSYSRKDDDPEGSGLISQVDQTISSQRQGVTFLDSKELQRGDQWRERINRNLDATAVFALFVSANSLSSSEVESEFTSFVDKLVEDDWPGIVLPIPVSDAAFDFFRTRSEETDGLWWTLSGDLDGPREGIGLSTFNFERRSLEDQGPVGVAALLLTAWNERADQVRQRLRPPTSE